MKYRRLDAIHQLAKEKQLKEAIKDDRTADQLSSVFIYGGVHFHKYAHWIQKQAEALNVNMFLLGRISQIVMVCILLWIIYIIARALWDERTALICMGAAAVMPFFLSVSLQFRADTLLALYITLSLLFMIYIVKKGYLIDYLLAGFFLGLASGVKLTAIPFLAVLVTAHTLQADWHKLTFKKVVGILFDFRLIGAALAFALAYLIVNWEFVFYYFPLGDYGIRAAKSWAKNPFITSMGRPSNIITYISLVLPTALTVPLYAAAIGGMIASVFKWKKEYTILFAGILLMGLLWSQNSWTMMRYVMPVIAFMTLFIGILFYTLSKKITPFIIIIAALALCIYPALFTAAYSIICSKKAPQTITADWIQENYPAGTKALSLVTFADDYSVSPPLSSDYPLTKIAKGINDFSESEALELSAIQDQGYDLITVPGQIYEAAERVRFNDDIYYYTELMNTLDNCTLLTNVYYNLEIAGMPIKRRDTTRLEFLDYMYQWVTIRIYQVPAK